MRIHNNRVAKLIDHYIPPISASSLCRLRSSQGLDLFISHVRTTMAHTRSFASIGPLLWNHLPPPFHSFIVSAPLSLSPCLTFFVELICTESAYVWLAPCEALYKY